MQLIANMESMAVDTAATMDIIAKEVRSIRKISRTRLAIAETEIRELRARVATLETGRAEQSMSADGLPDSRGYTSASPEAKVKARMTPAQRREAMIKEAYDAGVLLADKLIDAAIAAFNDNKDPTSLVGHINKTLKSQRTFKKLAHGNSCSCDAIIWGYNERGKERRAEMEEACDAMNARLGLPAR
jgi:hypothetical protein